MPAVLWLHGAMTYIWPETLYKDLRRCVDANAVARRMLIVAPLATCGEPLAVVSETRRKENRYGVEEPYVDSFDADRTWSAFLAVCHALGPERVDFGRLCVTGLSWEAPGGGQQRETPDAVRWDGAVGGWGRNEGPR